MTALVGIINVTPDSFHDGGKFLDVALAVTRAREMLGEGADIIEIGGESTGPKSSPVSPEEELRRVIPVIRAIRSAHPSANISIDTWKAAVATAAVREGAMMINDVTAGRGDPEMLPLAANAGVNLVLMYAKDDSPRTTIEERQYTDVVATITEFLAARKQAALAAGVREERIILDPGLGHFVSSDARYSHQILARLQEFSVLGCSLFLSPSRKSFLAGPENLPTKDRLPGTIAASAIAVLHGARYIRTHDVGPVRQGCAAALQVQAMQTRH